MDISASIEAGTCAEGDPPPGPRLRLFGTPLLVTGAYERPLAPDRRNQVVAYVACRGGWVPRTELAAMLWDAHAEPQARRNLRRMLHDVRRQPGFEQLGCRGDALVWEGASDVGDFAAAFRNQDWEACVRLGADLLLQGFENGAPDRFHDWLGCERQSSRARWREAVARRRTELRADPAGRIELARFALVHEPLDEGLLGDLVESLRTAGRDAEAQVAWRQFAARMRAELGIEPAIGAPPDAAAAVLAAPACQEPAATGCAPLIGRRLQQAQLGELLRREDCRRVTILGPGGVGKSALAATAPALLAQDFPDGIRWVGLRDLASAAQVPSRVAEACGFKGALSHDPLVSLASRIGFRRMLLVLDNCEHLPSIREIVDALAGACPRVKFLHTSRARVGGEGEWLLPLGGLAVPDPEEHEPEAIENFDSIRLFVARASVVDPDFDARRILPDAARLVRLVEGLPLAIEIAAACTRLLPLAEIVADISRLLDMPGGCDGCFEGARSAGAGLRASFEHSWRLLSAQERGTFARLAVFGGSFSLDAAACVADAGLPAIAALADKSLVAPAGDARFSLHPLVRELAREHLDDEQAARDRHAAYFADLMQARADPKAGGSVPWGHEDMSHCLEAWRWATATGDLDLLLRMAMPLVRLFNRYLRWHDGIEAIEATLASLPGHDARSQLLRARLGYGLAQCRFYNGEMAAAESAARASLRLCHALRIRDHLPAGNLYFIGASLAWRGEMARARSFLDQSRAIAQARAEPESAAKALYGLGFLEQAAGHWARARQLYEQSRRHSGALGTWQWFALALNGAGVCWLAENRLDEAMACFEEGVRVCTEHEVHGRRSFLHANRGLVMLRRGRPDEARKCIEQALREAQEWNVCTAHMESHLAACALGIAVGDLAHARDELRAAMRVARKIQSPLRRMIVVRHFGEWLVAAGHRERGAAVLEFVKGSAMSLHRDKECAERLLRGMLPARPPGMLPKGLARGLSQATLEEEILADQSPALPSFLAIAARS